MNNVLNHSRWVLLALSSLLNLIFVVPYGYAIMRGSVRPNRVTWFLWLLLAVVSLLAVLKAGGRYEAVFNLCIVVGEGLIFGLALFKGETVFTRLDAVALGGGLLALASLLVLTDPLWTLLAVLVTDLFGFIPTWAKSWRDPASESLPTFLITFSACLCGYLAVADGALIYFLYPLYLTLGNGVLVAILFWRRASQTGPENTQFQVAEIPSGRDGQPRPH